jgi:N-acyl-D-aspartate/D-glutamate deacylase
LTTYDVVLRGGRVIDPESGLDRVQDVAVSHGEVAEIGNAAVSAPVDLDVRGHIVTAGFVDVHSHTADIASMRLRALDGVTTSLELEAGASPVGFAYQRMAATGSPVNYGFSASWTLARMAAVGGLDLDGRLGSLMGNIATPGWQRAASPGQLEALLSQLSDDLADGAIGIGLLLGYAPGTQPQEYLRIAALAAEAGVPTFTHARDLVEIMPTALVDGAEEIVRAAGETGAHMHYCHINSTSLRHIDRVQELVGRAQAAGSQVTTEAYPYGSGMTGIGAAFLAPERLPERDLKPADLTYAPTGEQVASEARLRELRAADPGGLVIIRHLDEDDPDDRAVLLRALSFPDAIVASDAMPLTWSGPVPDPEAWPMEQGAFTHPRTAGTFARALRLLAAEPADGPVGDGGPLGITEALRRCSLRPAQLLESTVPAMRRKGRLQPGSDADIVVFNPATIRDRATYSDSTRPSAGITHVLVNGAFVVRDAALVPNALPGRPVRGAPR